METNNKSFLGSLREKSIKEMIKKCDQEFLDAVNKPITQNEKANEAPGINTYSDRS